MGTVRALRGHEHAALGEAVTAFLATLDHPESRGTRRVYASTLCALRAEFGDAADTARARAAAGRRLVHPAVGAGGTVHLEQEPGRDPVSAAILA